MVERRPNALEIGAVLLPARNHKIQVGTDSRAAVIVFVHFPWFVTKSCKSCMDLSARKVKGKLRGVSFSRSRIFDICGSGTILCNHLRAIVLQGYGITSLPCVMTLQPKRNGMRR